MKTFLSTLAVALAITFMATPAYALDDLAKCRVYNAKIKMNYAKCLELDKLLVEKGKAPKGNCDSKRTASLEKATAKFVTKLDVNDAACGIDTETADGDQALQWLASGDGSLTAEQVDIITEVTLVRQKLIDVCEAAGGTWDSATCTPGPNAYPCWIGATCSQFAEKYPENLEFYTNSYVGHTAATSGCPQEAWNQDNEWADGLMSAGIRCFSFEPCRSSCNETN